MARLAIFIDGGYLDALAEHEFSIFVDYSKIAEAIREIVNAKTPEPVDILRTLYYHCLPYQSNPPTDEEKRRYSRKRRIFDAIGHLPRFAIRQGRLVLRGYNTKGEPIFQQKRTDLLLGLDFALLSGKKQITHAAVIAGDSDLLPAFQVAKDEGISVWLFHGPRVSKKDGKSTYADDLWREADERFEIDLSFMNRIALPPNARDG
jgi:uncharacterized LabA/DUF88 family protein